MTDRIRDAAEKLRDTAIKNIEGATLYMNFIESADFVIRDVVERERTRCINEIEAMRDCYNTKKVDDVLDRIRQGGES